MSDTLKLIRDLTVIIAIYLFFIAWVYVHFYYHQFGVSTDAVRIDYNSYLMYSYNVLTSEVFFNWIRFWFWIILLVMALALLAKLLTKKFDVMKKLVEFLSTNVVVVYLRTSKSRSLFVFLLLSIIIFPQLFRISREVAINNYKEDRSHPEHLKTIQFIFREDANLLSSAVILDSAISKDNIFYGDISVIKNDSQQLLRLLGESDKYYIVLQQQPVNKQLGVLATGYVYFIDKKDILLSKIILRSTKLLK